MIGGTDVRGEPHYSVRDSAEVSPVETEETPRVTYDPRHKKFAYTP
jgi:hypothetical protein